MDSTEDKAACLSIARNIEDDVHSASTHRKWNTTMMSVLILLAGINFWRGCSVQKAVQKDYELSLANSNSISDIKAKQDLYREQYLTYIQDTIQFMQALQDQNAGKIKVPKAPVPRLPNTKITEEDLRRIPQTKPGPSPTPIVKTVTKTKTRKVYVRPTPRPLSDWFKKSR